METELIKVVVLARTSSNTGSNHHYLAPVYKPGSDISTWLQYGSNISTWLQYMYITVIYLPKSNISTWLQFIYLAPIYLPGSNLSTWLQCLICIPGRSGVYYLPSSLYIFYNVHTVRTRKLQTGKTTL